MPAWYKRNPELANEIQRDLRQRYPNLHFMIVAGRTSIHGAFPVRTPDGMVLDRYQISIELPPDFPKSLPVVREIGGRIPWKADYHIERDGTACVLMPDDRWRCFPVGAPFVQYLDGPLYNFFLGQTVFAETGEWPFGQWSHGKDGIYEYYRWLLDTADDLTVWRFLHTLAKGDRRKRYACPCGSGRKIRKCCFFKIRDLRKKIPAHVAAAAIRRLRNNLQE